MIGGFLFDALVLLPFLAYVYYSPLEGWKIDVAEFVSRPSGKHVAFAIMMGPMLAGTLLDGVQRLFMRRSSYP